MEISGVNSIRGEINIPGDKSISHRAAIISALASNQINIKNFLLSQDCINTLNILKKLGVKIEKNNSNVIIHGLGIQNFIEPDDILYVGNSGTTIRLLSGVLCAAKITAVLSGDKSINNRPMDRIIFPLKDMGANIYGRNNNSKAPIIILPSYKLKGRIFNIPISSAQVKSCIILAGLFAEGVTEIIQPEVSRDHTERLLEYFGVEIKYDGKNTKVFSLFESNLKGEIKGKNLYIPGDLSSATYFIVASCILPNSSIIMKNIGINPTRSKVLDILQLMGANIEIKNKKVINNELVADIESFTSNLKAIKVDKNLIPIIIDEIPALCVASVFADGETIIEGAEELRHKESDRINSIYNEFLKAGVDIKQKKDGLIIKGNKDFKPNGGIYESYKDHRIAMSLAILGLKSNNKIRILDSECIETSFPGFLFELKKVLN